jgi:ammonia channel protein AmtB
MPGLFYGGMARKKNVGDTVMKSFAVTCLVTILFAILLGEVLCATTNRDSDG